MDTERSISRRWALVASGKLIVATLLVAVGQAYYFVNYVRVWYEIDRPDGWDAASFWVTVTVNSIIGIFPLLATLLIAYFNRSSRNGQIVAAISGAKCWLLLAGAILTMILGMDPAALWPYPVFGVSAYSVALVIRRDLWRKVDSTKAQHNDGYSRR